MYYSRLEDRLASCDSIRVQVVFQFAKQLMDGANLAIPIETKFFQDALQINYSSFVPSVSKKHLNFGATNDISQRDGRGGFLDDLHEFLPIAIHLVNQVHHLSWR